MLPVLRKVYDQVLYARLNTPFESTNLLIQNQYGSQTGRNTEYALLKFPEDVIDEFDDGEVTEAIFMDLSNAFKISALRS